MRMATGTDSGQIPPMPPDETGRPVVLYVRPGPNGCRDIQRFGTLWQKVRSYPGSAHHTLIGVPPSLHLSSPCLQPLPAVCTTRTRTPIFFFFHQGSSRVCNSTPAPLGKIWAHSFHISSLYQSIFFLIPYRTTRRG